MITFKEYLKVLFQRTKDYIDSYFQTKEDDALETESKTIVGAINELKQYGGTGETVDLSDYYTKSETNETISSEINSIESKIIGAHGIGIDAEVFNKLKANSAMGDKAHAEGFSSAEVPSEINANTTLSTITQNYYVPLNGKTFALAFGDNSHIEGEDNLAGGRSSHAEGGGTQALGNFSHAEGTDTMASAVSAHAEGATTVARGSAAHAEGNSTRADGINSHAEGGSTQASGRNSHAEGYSTTASKDNAHAEGAHTTAASMHQHVQGIWNIIDENGVYAHIVGNGSSAGDRSNAHTVKWNGDGWFKGDVYVGTDNVKLVDTNALTQAISTAIESKVDKVAGKGLSSNDFTTTEKQQLANLVNNPIQADWSETDENSPAFIKNKPTITSDGEAVEIKVDYNEDNPDSPNYIKNRPFYSATVDIFPQQILTFEPASDEPEALYQYKCSSKLFDIEPNVEYFVQWDGINFKPTVQYDEGTGSYAIGNAYFTSQDEKDNTGEPFLIFCVSSPTLGDTTLIGSPEPTSEHLLRVYKKEFKYLDSEFIKDMYYDNTGDHILFNNTIELLNAGGEITYETLLTEEQSNLLEKNWSTLSIEYNGESYNNLSAFMEVSGVRLFGNTILANPPVPNGIPFILMLGSGVLFVLGIPEDPTTTENIICPLKITLHINDFKQIDNKYLSIMEESNDGWKIKDEFLPEVGSISGQVQADYNENNSSKSSFIKNRPFYEESSLELLFDGELSIHQSRDNLYQMYNPISFDETKIAIGKDYKVNFNGVEYNNLTATLLKNEQNGDVILLGNHALCTVFPEVQEHLADTGEPFVIIFIVGQNMFTALHTSSGDFPFSIEKINKNIKHIDRKYIKDMYGEEVSSKKIIDNLTVDLTLFENMVLPFYGYIEEGADQSIISEWESDWSTATVIWDNIEYNCTVYNLVGAKVLGNAGRFVISQGMESMMPDAQDTGEPFMIMYASLNGGMCEIISFDDTPSANSVTHTFSVIANMNKLVQIDPKYIKDMYYEKAGAKFSGSITTTMIDGMGAIDMTNANPLTLKTGNTYIVTFMGNQYSCTCESFQGMPYIGNLYLGDPYSLDTGEPFVYVPGLGIITQEAGTFDITIEEASVINKIDNKYLSILKPTGATTIIPEQNVTAAGQDGDTFMYLLNNAIAPTLGQHLYVNYDSILYESVVKSDFDMYFIGNGNYSSSGLLDTGEPFCISWIPGVPDMLLTKDGLPHTISVSTQPSDYVIDKKYVDAYTKAEIDAMFSSFSGGATTTQVEEVATLLGGI